MRLRGQRMVAAALAVVMVFVLAGVAGASRGEGYKVASGPPLTILVVGYGWYRGIPEGQVNNAETIARALDNEMIIAKDERGRVVGLGKVQSIVVPVTWYGAFPPVVQAIKELNPDIVLGLGTAVGITGLRVEPFGVNWGSGTDADPEDPSREVTWNGPLVPGGPEYHEGTLPFDEIVLAMRRSGIPAYKGTLTDRGEGQVPRYSTTTGTYLCNLMAYMLAHHVQEYNLDIDVGFIHVPTRPEYAAQSQLGKVLTSPPSASMEIERMIEGVRIALQECVRAKVQNE